MLYRQACQTFSDDIDCNEKNLKKVSSKHFSNETFRKGLLDRFSKGKFANNEDGLPRFCKLSIKKYATPKKKYARDNQMPFLTKRLSIAIKTRSRLCSNHLKNRNEENRTFNVK